MAVRNPKMLFSDEEGDEEQPLLLQRRICHRSKKPRCCSCFSCTYRLVKMTEKGGILMIAFNTLFVMAMITCFQNATFERLNINTKFLTIPCFLVLLLCPVLGLLSECYFGKYKIFQISIYSLLVALVLSALGIIITSTNIWYMALVPLFFPLYAMHLA